MEDFEEEEDINELLNLFLKGFKKTLSCHKKVVISSVAYEGKIKVSSQSRAYIGDRIVNNCDDILDLLLSIKDTYVLDSVTTCKKNNYIWFFFRKDDDNKDSHEALSVVCFDSKRRKR